METPSTTRRVTGSQTLAAGNNGNSVSTSRKIEESEMALTKSRQRTGKQQDRSALIDITNDSPIIGLAMGSLETPSSAMSKKRVSNCDIHDSTPGSGEALLRGQVKTLLQTVEEELSLEQRPFLHPHALLNSPMSLLAPTPSNTPQIVDLSGNGSSLNNGLAAVSPSPVEDKLIISQMVTEIFEGKKGEGSDESVRKSSMITRSLLLDFSEKSEGSYSSECSSAMTYQGENEGQEKATAEDDDASIWSIQVNASTRDGQEEDEEEAPEEAEEDCDNEYYCYYDCDEEVEKQRDEGSINELCKWISKISVNGNGEKNMAKFAGKHTRFLYNSDDELEEEVVCSGESDLSASITSLAALHLKGLPTPEELDEDN